MDRSKYTTSYILTAFRNDLTDEERNRSAFLIGAKDYLDASNALGTIYSASAYMVAFHSIELGLKAYLSIKGVNIHYLIKCYGHDLTKLYRECEKLGMIIATPEADGLIEWFNEFHSYRAPIRYEFADRKPLPSIGYVRQVATEIVAAA